MTKNDSPEAIAERMKAMILVDIRERTVPASVSSFEELHDHVDANMYLSAACSPETAESQINNDFREFNAAIELVHDWLRDGKHRVARSS